MAQLVPSILESSREDFWAVYAQEIKLPGVSRIQVDFGDGVFVPNRMLPVSELDVLSPAVDWEAHLMLQAPLDFLDYQICGFKTIIIHYEAYSSAAEVGRALAAIAAVGLQPALCIKNETPVEVLPEFAGQTSHFQLMSVKPGFQGTPFLENTYGRIAALRRLLPNAIIEVDGGVKLENIRQLAASGADYLILGSSITKAPSMPEAFQRLQDELVKA
ncbi:MAG TPA: hypothetical protein VHA30_03970 [Patescibacteria group bacterium]|nr:hypothetical protein [Patescibacteria group bacterium]